MNMTRMVLCGVVILNGTVIWGMEREGGPSSEVKIEEENEKSDGEGLGTEVKSSSVKGVHRVVDDNVMEEVVSPQLKAEKQEWTEDGEILLRNFLGKQAKIFVDKGGKLSKEEEDIMRGTNAFLEKVQKAKYKGRKYKEENFFSVSTARKIAYKSLEASVSSVPVGIGQGMGQTVGVTAGKGICGVASWTYDKIRSLFLSEEESKKRAAVKLLNKKGTNLREYSTTISEVLSPYVELLNIEDKVTSTMSDPLLYTHMPPELKQEAKATVDERRIKALIKVFVAHDFSQEAAEAFKIDGQNSGKSSSIIRELQGLLEKGPTPPQNQISRPSTSIPRTDKGKPKARRWKSETKIPSTKVEKTLKSTEEKNGQEPEEKKSDITTILDKKDDGSASIPKPVESVIRSA
jgi:hypothetical protein